MSRNSDALYNLISTKLDANTYGVDFRTDIYNSKQIKYFERDDTGQKYRFVPTMITDVIGQYINIPNANSTSNSVGVQFEIFSGTVENKDTDIAEFSKVGYNDTLNAIEEFKNSLSAKYFPLGTPYLYMGGEDSTFTVDLATATDVDKIVLDFKPYNTDEETLIYFYAFPNTILKKDDENIIFQITTGVELSIPYTAKERIEITITKNSSDLWTMTDGVNNATPVTQATVVNCSKFFFAYSTGFEGIVYGLSIEDTISGGNEIVIDTWDSKDTITNSGDKVLDDGTIENCILWSDDGNSIFSFGTLNPVSDLHSDDGIVLYQTFEIEIEVFISNDVLFGNNFEYYLDGIQVYPVDRQHTYATEVSTAQKLNANMGKSIVEETLLDFTQSFYYIPCKKLTSILKHITSGTTAQNTEYTLVVQYPFFKNTYTVVIDSGGTSPNINELSTFTVSFKVKEE